MQIAVLPITSPKRKFRAKRANNLLVSPFPHFPLMVASGLTGLRSQTLGNIKGLNRYGKMNFDGKLEAGC
jgi:hypothetical protein